MHLVSVHIRRFRNFVDSGEVAVEPDVTALVGKNESGKSSLLHALFRLLPANRGYSDSFNLTEEYPRWRLKPDRPEASNVRPVEAIFEFDEGDREDLAGRLELDIPGGARCRVWRTYDNKLHAALEVSLPDALAHAAGAHQVDTAELEAVTATTIEKAHEQLQARSAELKAEGNNAGSTALKRAATTLIGLTDLVAGAALDSDAVEHLSAVLPRFFYFSDYALLPGEFDLNVLAAKPEDRLTEKEQTASALLRFANTTADDVIQDGFESRQAELEAAAIALTRDVFKYWKQNKELVVDFRDHQRHVPIEPPPGQPAPPPELHRFLNVRLRDNRHGGVSTNFSTRSTGFQWFFSFLAAFSEFEHAHPRVVVLLDEPGTSLHGEAQADFLRFIFERLGANQQVIYTTHSQHMIDPTSYEKLRAVEDQASPEDPDRGAVVDLISLNSDRDTVLPVQAALGYSINQHLILGAYRHLLVEGGADFIYLSEFSTFLSTNGGPALDPGLPMLPVGGADKIPPFVALLARHLAVSVLLDGGRGSRSVQRVLDLVGTTGFKQRQLVLCSDVDGVPGGADIEDMFAAEDYLRLFNWAHDTKIRTEDLPETNERMLARVEKAHGAKFDHGLVARQMAPYREEFFSGVSPVTKQRFSDLISRLNATA